MRIAGALYVCVVLVDQLLEPEESRLGDGKIRDSNRVTLITLLEENGIRVTDLGIAKDTYVYLILMPERSPVIIILYNKTLDFNVMTLYHSILFIFIILCCIKLYYVILNYIIIYGNITYCV